MGENVLRVAAALLPAAFFLWLAFRRPRAREEVDPSYRVFTREFDFEVDAAQAIAGLEAASLDAELGWLKVDAEAWAESAREADSLLAARAEAAAAGRNQALERLRQAAGGAEGGDFAIVVLIDQSAAGLGEPIALASATAALLVDLLARFGARSEVLGYSTAGWHGGLARREWHLSGAPPQPGRLCALRHIVYKTMDEDALSAASRHVLIHGDLLREGVHGESVLWARDRLAARPEKHKVLVVISQGSASDHATSTNNDPFYLYRHLLAVLAGIEADGDIALGVIGIRYPVGDYYNPSERLESADDVPEAGVRLLERMIAERTGRQEKAGFPPAQE